LPGLREVLLYPGGDAGLPATFAVRMPVEMRLGRPLFIELLWIDRAAGGPQEAAFMKGAEATEVRYSVRREYSAAGAYLGTAFASFVKCPPTEGGSM
jgi:hypothetical protein